MQDYSQAQVSIILDQSIHHLQIMREDKGLFRNEGGTYHLQVEEEQDADKLECSQGLLTDGMQCILRLMQ